MPPAPKDARARLAPLVAHVAREWRRAVDTHLQAYGLTEATWLPLLRIARSETPMRQNELAASLSLDGSSRSFVSSMRLKIQASSNDARTAPTGARRASS